MVSLERDVIKEIEQINLTDNADSKIKTLQSIVKTLAKEIDSLKNNRNRANYVSTVPPKGKTAWDKKY